jgi:hypothetical protein
VDFHVPCTCGKTLSVSAGQAGLRLTCPCGLIVEVPPLDELRTQAGLPPYESSATLVIADMLAHGELPTLDICANCYRPTEEILKVTVECEKIQGEMWERGSWFVVGFFGLFGWLVWLRPREARQHETNLILHLPVRVCRNCRPQLMSDPLTRVFAWLAIGFAVVGLAVMVLWTAWGSLLLAVSLLLWGAKRFALARRQTSLKQLLRQEPNYQKLLETYASAYLVVDAEES